MMPRLLLSIPSFDLLPACPTLPIPSPIKFPLTVNLLNNVQPDGGGEDRGQSQGSRGLSVAGVDSDGGTSGHFWCLSTAEKQGIKDRCIMSCLPLEVVVSTRAIRTYSFGG